MRPNKAETALKGCHMREVLARPWGGVPVYHLLSLSVLTVYYAGRKVALTFKSVEKLMLKCDLSNGSSLVLLIIRVLYQGGSDF